MARLLIMLLFLMPVLATATPETDGEGFLFFRKNRFDKEGRFHGRWKVYDNEDGHLIRKGRFRHGQEVGKWLYFQPNGNKLLEEKWKRRKGEILVKRYHENGKLKREGKARMEVNSKGVRYFWVGDWKVYDEQGNFLHTERYENGALVETVRL